MTPIVMVDGISLDVPVIHQRFPGHPVAGYVTGGYPIEWTPAQFAGFTRKIRIAQRLEPDIALVARAFDVERRTDGIWSIPPAALPGLLNQRQAAGHSDGTVYCDLYDVPAVLNAVGGSQIVPRWWLAWYWGHRGFPTVDQVLAELKALTGAELPPERIWAVQARNYPQYDLSAVYGVPDFSRQ